MKQKKIHIEKNVVSFREDATAIKKKHSGKFTDIFIDFSDVYFISRAFADELLNVIQELEHKGTKIHLQKMNSSVKNMLRVVKNWKNKIKKELREAA